MMAGPHAGKHRGYARPRQHPLGEVEPLFQLRHAQVQRIHLAEPLLELLHLGPERRRRGLPFPWSRPAKGPHDRPKDERGRRAG